MATVPKRLGDTLLESGKITEEQLHEALLYKEEHQTYLGNAVVTLGFLTEKELCEVLSEHLKIPYVNLMNYDIQEDVLDLVDEKIALRHKIMPIFFIEDTITIATSDPLNVHMVDDVSEAAGMDVNLVLAPESDIERTIDLFYGAARYERQTGGKKERQRGARVVSREIDQDTEIIEAVNILFDESIKVGASDIHIEPREDDVRIRFRVDGVLQQHYTVPKASMAPLISRVKILADMDIAESRKPQDGRFSYSTGNKKVDMRTSTYPTPNGEKVVMRLLDESKGNIELHKLGFQEKILNEWRKLINSPNGIILVSGPTGSGKTTTLYATLNVLNTIDVNIMTIEDPIEYRLNNITQGQLNVKAGMTFSAALRTMLRQDPDIIMVGEMRDVETIELAIRAALTGHLVFSTIHTNDAASSFTRILDMGIDNYLVSSTVRGVISQRLIRLLCPRCKKEYESTDELLQSLGIEEQETRPTLYKPVGCVHCRNSGYFGRAGVYELLIPDDEIVNLINHKASSARIEEIAQRNGMITLREAAINYVLTGKTSADEIFRVTLG